MGQGNDEGNGAAAVHPRSVTLVAEVLRSVAQVDFMPSVVCGLLFAAALFAAGPRYGLYGLLGSTVSTAATVLTPALAAVSAPFGGHAFTWPFVLTTMLFLAAVPAVPRLRRI
nr:urea transporter [Streptomyces novaecaesareae]